VTSSDPGFTRPWHTAGEKAATGDAVGDVGWVFNNEIGQDPEAFVGSGWIEVQNYFDALGLSSDDDAERSVVEVGSGIGRMTAALTQRFGHVVACDVDATFLDRCRETVVNFGVPDRLETAHVADAAHLPLADRSADVVFSYITLQHCRRHDALSLAAEAVRVCRRGGRVALNFRSYTAADAALVPAGWGVRALWRVAGTRGPLGHRSVVRLGWQANRLGPRDVLDHLVGHGLGGVTLYEHPRAPGWRRRLPSWQVGAVPTRQLDWINPSHWWLVADIA
jgi:SAM-dependent methyltransferase